MRSLSALWLATCFVPSHVACEQEVPDEYEYREESYQDGDSLDPDFYMHPKVFVWIDGHMWAPVLLRHHPDCPCQD